MSNPFIYDPSKSIRESGRESADMLQDAFKPVIQKKINDFNLVKDLYENIELERKELNEYNESEINKKIEGALGSLSESILKNGKLDYKKVGEMRTKVADIRNAKDKSKMTLDSYREKIELLYKNADKMHDIEGTIGQMRKAMKEQDFLFNPNDASQRFDNIYSEGVDMKRLLNKRVKELTKTASNSITNINGDRLDVKAPLMEGYTIGPNGDVVISGDPVLVKRATGSILSEREKAVFARQLGPAMAFDGDVDKYISETVLGLLNADVDKKFIRSKEQIEKDLQSIAASKASVKNQEARTKISQDALEIQRQGLGIRQSADNRAQEEFQEKKKSGYYTPGGGVTAPNPWGGDPKPTPPPGTGKGKVGSTKVDVSSIFKQ